MKTVHIPKRWLRKLARIAVITTAILTARPATAQDGQFSYGRGMFGSPSGSASEVVDSNRHGLGMAFRGGHVAGHTVGREDSITHIGLMPYINIEDGLFFGDTRLARGNDGGLVWNFGGGYRHYITEWDVVVGGNGYVDNDELTGANLKQWGTGVEFLANRWEARGNYYRTFGETSQQVGSRVDQSSVSFVNQNIQFTRIDSFAESMDGWDSEIGFLLPGDISERFDLRAFGGGYFFEGENIEGIGGWSTRLQADVANWLELGLKVTDDELFKTTVSFNVAMHFGGFNSQEHTKRSAIQRFDEPVRRNMNIVTSATDVAAPGQIATNPNTNNPFTVAHVNSNNNVGPFLGTVDNPYRSLSVGLNSGTDIVFTHAGSSFNGLPDNVVNLAVNQQLLGEGQIIAQTGNRLVENRITLGGVGDLLLPSSPTFINSGYSLARPTLSGSVGNAVTMGHGSQLSGFIVDSPSLHGIFSNGARDTIINDSLIRNAGGSGIFLSNTADSTTIRNTIIDSAVGPALHVDGGNGRIGFGSTSTKEDPSWAAIINSSQEAVLIENMTAGSVNMTGSTIDDTGGNGIVIRNNAGSATIDNANIVDSLTNGISVLNSSGVYTFRDTIRTATVVDNAVDDAISIDGLLAGGRLSFENLSVLNRQAAGIRVSNNAGEATFGGQSITIGPPALNSDPAVAVSNSAATGLVTFARNLTINGSNGRGIELTGNADGSQFRVTGATSVTSAATESIAIVNDSGISIFAGGTTINQRGVAAVGNIPATGGTGILVENSNGSVTFQNATAITNGNVVTDSAVDVHDSESTVSFASLGVLNSTGNPAVSLMNNVAGLNGTALISITDLVIVSAGGQGLFGLNNTNLRISDGTINTTGASAVDLEETGINVSLERVDSLASPNFGIRLVETNKTNGFNQFKVTGDPTQAGIGTGGTIQSALTAGVLMQNAGQVRIERMILDDNENGFIIQNSGLAVDDDQKLELFTSQISRSDVRGIYSRNLIVLDVRDTLLTDNGDDAAMGRETLLAEYDELLNANTTTRFDDFDNPYEVTLLRNTIIENSTDAVVIGSLAAASGAHLFVNLDGNNFNVTDTIDPTTPLVATFPVNTFDGDRTRDDAIVVVWNGPTRQNYTTNSFLMSGGAPQTAFDLRTLSTTDLLELNLVGNQLDSRVTGTITGQQNGLLLRTFGQSTSNISQNDFRFTGGEGRGMDFSLAANTSAFITNNTIVDNTDGGAGIIFSTVAQPSSFTISGNSIGLFDLGAGIEEGIRFNAVAGVVNLFGTQNNLVVLGNPNTQGAFIESIFSMPAGTNNGQIIVNGVPVP